MPKNLVPWDFPGVIGLVSLGDVRPRSCKCQILVIWGPCEPPVLHSGTSGASRKSKNGWSLMWRLYYWLLRSFQWSGQLCSYVVLPLLLWWACNPLRGLVEPSNFHPLVWLVWSKDPLVSSRGPVVCFPSNWWCFLQSLRNPGACYVNMRIFKSVAFQKDAQMIVHKLILHIVLSWLTARQMPWEPGRFLCQG